jgi:hypothetical protein
MDIGIPNAAAKSTQTIYRKRVKAESMALKD